MSYVRVERPHDGIALVTLLRLLQVPHKVKEHVQNPTPDVEAS